MFVSVSRSKHVLKTPAQKRESNKTATKPEKILFFSVKKFQDGANASF
jgi:hypothetical protein